MDSAAIFAGLSDEAVVLVALLWESGGQANASPEMAGVAERINAALPDLITEELKRREVTPQTVGLFHFNVVIERMVTAMREGD